MERKLLVTMSPDWDWKNFGKKKKKSPHPHRRGDRPPQTVNPRPLSDLKREAAFSDWHLFNTATVRRLLLRCLCQIRTSLCLSIMFRMLKHHLHPGIFLLFMWLCHLMEHQKVQGKLSSSVFSSSVLDKLRLLSVSEGARVSNSLICWNRETFQSQFSFCPPADKNSLCIRQCVRKASIKQVPYGTLQSETIWQVLQQSPGAYT